MAALGRETRLRGADVVMAPRRAGAAFPTPLSFSRSLLRKMVAERWRITRTVFELDREGRGEALYRVDAPTHAFHVFVVSDVFPADQKIDRAFGVNWDVSAAICEGAWSEERRACLADEVPQQYDGRYPADVLCFCRGNRSERVFDHVVDALAAGRQPDTALLASVGYLLRSTAFAGNGLFGMKPFEAFGPDHPLRATYHAQILAAYLLRIFVFDLAEHIAAARSAEAARLDPGIKRYLGLGNSAGLGLVPFIMGHPHIVHRWCLAQESAFAEALDRPVDAAGLETLISLLERAAQYFRQDPRDGNGIFADYGRLAAEFEMLHGVLSRLTVPNGISWRALRDAILPRDQHPETAEAFLALLLELFPDIVARWDDRLVADETHDLDPTMTVERLSGALQTSYSWLLSGGRRARCPRFWYYPLESPYEPRRGLRGTGSTFEAETPMDLPRLVPRLVAMLASAPSDQPVGVFVARHPEFALLVRRVQALAGLDYAELRVDTLAADYLPFAACRFLLAFYGMDKYDPRLPRSTKGALLQGAPLPEEIAEGQDGTWPFPLAPETVAAEAAPAIVPQRLVETPEVAIGTLRPLRKPGHGRTGEAVTVFPAEMRKLLSRAAFGAGLDAVAADAAVRLAMLVADGWIDATLPALEDPADDRPLCTGTIVDGQRLPDFAVAPAVLDLAGGLAGDGVGTTPAPFRVARLHPLTPAKAGVQRAVGSRPSPGRADGGSVRAEMATGRCRVRTPLLAGLALWGAERGFLTAVVDHAAQRVGLAGGTGGAVWHVACRGLPAERLEQTPLAPLAMALAAVRTHEHDAAAEPESASFAALCLRRSLSWPEAAPLLRLLDAVEVAPPDEVGARRRRAVVEGFRLSPLQFRHLSRLAKRGLVPPHVELHVTGQAVAAA